MLSKKDFWRRSKEKYFLSKLASRILIHAPLISDFIIADFWWSNAHRPTFSTASTRGVFRSVGELKDAINRFVTETNANPKPFMWTADPRRVLAAVKRGKQALESVH